MEEYVAIITRVSPKPNGKGLESCDDQLSWGTTYAARVWPGLPIREYRDERLSGADQDRPGLNGFRADLKTQAPKGVWAVEQSRLCRDEQLWFTIQAEMMKAGLGELHTDRDGLLVLGDLPAGVKALVYAAERRTMLRRQSDTLAAIAARGEPPGSRPFGYRHAKVNGVRTYVIVPEQADAIRYAADRFLDGVPLETIAEELSGRMRGAHGGVITGNRVGRMLTNPTVAGKRVHKGRVLGDGNWPAILDEETYQAVKDRFASAREVTQKNGSTYVVRKLGTRTRRKYELSGGLAICGECGAPLVGSVKQLRNAHTVRSVPYYLCMPRLGGKGCVGISAEPTEAVVAERLFDELDKPEFRKALAVDSGREERERIGKALASLERRRDEAADRYADEIDDARAYDRTKARLDDRERKLRAELAALPKPVADVDLSDLGRAALRAAWPLMELGERRELLETFVGKVVVNRATRRGGVFDPGRIVVHF